MSFSGRGYLGWPTALALLVAILAVGTGAVLLTPAGGAAATWWPAAGIGVSLVALSPRHRWWLLALGILVVTLLANLAGGRPPTLSAVYGVANAAEALVAAWCLRRDHDRVPDMSSLDDFLRLVRAAVLGGLTIAAIAGLGVVLLTGSGLLDAWRGLLVGHAASTLVIVPIAVTARRRHPRGFRWELPLQVTALALVTLAVFAPDETLSLAWVPLPFLLWGALRFDVHTVACEVLGFAVATTYLSSQGYGAFAFDHDRGVLSEIAMGAVVQAYVLAAAVMALPLAVTIEQRRRLLDRLTRSERLFRRNFTESVVGMLMMRSGSDPFEIVDLNESAARILGGGPSPLGRRLGDLLDTREPLELVSARMLAGNLDGWKAQTGLRDRPGARVNVALSLVTTDPEPMFAAQLHDVTTEYDARRRLEAAEKLTSAALDTTAAIILVTDLEGTIVRVNDSATRLTGFAREELLGRRVWEAPFAPEDATELQAVFTWQAWPGAVVGRETDALTRNGDRLRVVWNSGVVRNEHDRPAYVVITGTDVTAERTAAGLNAHLLQAAVTTALIGIDTSGLITVFNSGAERLLGYDEREMVGRPFVDLLDPEELWVRTQGRGQAAFSALVADIGRHGVTATRDWTWISRDGRPHTVSMTLSVAADAFAARVGYLCVGRDVTEARSSQEMLVAALEKERTAVERLHQLDQAKNEFVSTVSHELRTPVTSIVGYTEMLQDGSVCDPLPEQERVLESIARNGQRLILLCNDLLTLGGLDAGAAHWERDVHDLSTLLPPVEEAICSIARERDLTVSFTSCPGPVRVLGDQRQLERLLLNLLSNAVKFTDDGGRVECRVGIHEGEAQLSVSDTGIGIPQEEQAGLFQRFFRSSTAQQRAIPGTGLGLSIVAAIVAAHGGRIDVRSAHLEGTTFTVRLPLAPAGAAATRG